jgi:hypothetical protein
MFSFEASEGWHGTTNKLIRFESAQVYDKSSKKSMGAARHSREDWTTVASYE